jgi:hypothetical protein
MDQAKAAFFFHIMNDPSWTNHYDEQQLISFVGDLK